MKASDLVEKLNEIIARSGDHFVYWSENPRGDMGSVSCTACDVYMGAWSKDDPPVLIPRVWLSFGDVIGGIKQDQRLARGEFAASPCLGDATATGEASVATRPSPERSEGAADDVHNSRREEDAK